MILFQLVLIVGGNYSFLNWITIVACIGYLDDRFLRRMLPKWITRKADAAARRAQATRPSRMIILSRSAVSMVVLVAVAWLSIPVVQNLLSHHQAMNASFNQFDLVNTYGAFGSVGKVRNELIIEGTDDKEITPQAVWKEYEFKAKPSNPNRRLPIIAPYQYRLDWQIWFAAMQPPQQNPWLAHLVWKFLHNDKDALSLIAGNPFPDKPPQYIRIQFYRYEFLPPWNGEGVWNRTLIGTWLQPVSASTPGFQELIDANRWKS